MAKSTVDSTSEFLDRLMNDAQFRESLEAAPTQHDKGQLIVAAGYNNVNADALRVALKDQLAAVGAGVKVDPARAKRAEELFAKAGTDKELQQALQAAATPEAKREVLTKAGYGDVTLEDLKAAAADLAQREELSDDELEMVSGGNTDSMNAWLGAALPIMTTGAGIGFAVGGPIGAGVGIAVGLVSTIVASIYAPPISDW